jgi:NodT family efflux transporter outer membrane factor (OMF) lipoprotein
VPAPDAWKTQLPWQPAAPKDSIPKGEWWTIFHDVQLNGYEQQLLTANPSLAAARDNLEQARSLARVASADFFPQFSTDPNGLRQRISGNRQLSGATPPLYPMSQGVYNIPFSLNYEADLFGSVRSGMRAANATLQATAADLQNAQLVLTAELAADYFSLRELDAEMQVVQASVEIEQKGLDLVNRRHDGGIASGLEVAQQASLLDGTKTQLSLVEQQRKQYEHAVAVLTGNTPSNFSVPPSALNGEPPPIPAGVPSDLLERRPDIASAERTVAYENAQVGIARSAFYPRLSLTNSGGFQSRDISTLLTAPSAVWTVGGDLLQPIFSGGRNHANLAAAKAAYDSAAENYRQSVLTAFQQVEDSLSGLDTLARAAATQAAAVQDSQHALDIANNRYVGGVTNYLDVITAQATLLTNQRLAVQLLGQRMVTSAYLVKALGGGWEASELEKEQVHPRVRQAIQQ